jgi:hypothetical protein
MAINTDCMITMTTPIIPIIAVRMLRAPIFTPQSYIFYKFIHYYKLFQGMSIRIAANPPRPPERTLIFSPGRALYWQSLEKGILPKHRRRDHSRIG